MTATISLNAFSTLTVHDVVIENGVLTPQTLTRGTVRRGPHVSMILKKAIKPGGFPTRPPSLLPSPGNLHLEVKLGQHIGDGRVGSVYNAILANFQTGLPPLILKISFSKRSKNLAQEAWFYEELEQCQGISVPRCYGFFQVRLMPGSKPIMWPDERKNKSSQHENREADEDEEDEYEREQSYLSILILEKLGGRMPVGECLEESLKKDVYELFDDIARLGIETLDVRWSNILMADEESAADQPVCPNHGHRHKWRLVDFDHARKTDGRLFIIRAGHSSYLGRLFNNLVDGYIIEPWE